MAEYEFIICNTTGQAYVVAADSEEEAVRLYEEGLYDKSNHKWDMASHLVEIKMKRYRIVTTTTCTYETYITAEDEDAALKAFWDGGYVDQVLVDEEDERIEDVEEITND